MKKPKQVGTRDYILTLKDGNTRRITVPSNWKMTYGSVAPWANTQGGGVPKVYALRLYEGSKENLRAVMTDVVAIRDASIPVLEKRTSVQRKAAQKHTVQGARDVIIEARMTEWVNPDAEEANDDVPAEFLKLNAPELE